MLTSYDQKRYNRQIMIKEIGISGQEQLKNARVLIAGAGGLGSPVAIYLAAAGVGSIRIVDDDMVELSNLNRQILHWDENIGQKKVTSSAQKLQKLNSAIKIEALEETITEKNVLKLCDDCDLIVDAMDNLSTRWLLNEAALKKKIPFIHGAVNGFEGRVMTVIPENSACLRCINRGPVHRETFPVIGVTPAVIGGIQATEAIKCITGIGELLTNRLLVFDGLNSRFTQFKIKKNPECIHCGKPKQKT